MPVVIDESPKGRRRWVERNQERSRAPGRSLHGGVRDAVAQLDTLPCRVQQLVD
jgi:hypothetical protein